MSSTCLQHGAGELVAGSRFEELLQQLQQEHSRVVKQLLEERPPHPLGPRHASRVKSVSFATLEDVDAPSHMPPMSEMMPKELPSELPCSVRETVSSSIEGDREFFGSRDRVETFGNSVGDETSLFQSERSDDAPVVRSASAHTTHSTHTSDSHNGVRHVRRMLDRWGRSGSQGSIDSATSALGEKSLGVASFISTKVTGFLEATEEADLFAKSNAENTQDRNYFYRLRKVVLSPTFELVFAILIFVNTMVLAIEAQYDGIKSGYENELGQTTTPASDVWPGAERAFDVFETGFGILFTIEITIKICAMRRAFCRDPWNAVDFIIVLFWLLERVFKTFLPLDPKIVRMARLARLLRFLRIVKTIQAFDSLYLMVSSIKSSFSALAWSSVVLLLGEMMLALFLNVLLEDFWSDTANLVDDREEVYSYFGTFTKALQTMIEMLLGNWYTITRVLTSKVSEWYMLFGITHQLVVGFAVIEVITGVFLHETFKVANLDDGILLNETKREIKDQTEKMMRFFKHADLDESGELDPEEFREVLAKDKVQEWMSAQGIDVHNIDKVFGLFDKDGNGKISPEELIAGTLNLKGQAKAMELAIVRAMIEDIHQALQITVPRGRSKLYSRYSADGGPGRRKSTRRRSRSLSSFEDS